MTNNKDKKVLNVPNLRFPEFTDKWEAGKLEEYILLVSGQDLSSEQYTDKEDVYPYITGASSLNSEGIILNRWTHTPTQIVKRGDILLVCKGSGVGQLTVLSNVDKAHIARQIMGIRAKNTESQLFIYHYLSRLMTELKKRSTGIIPGIDRKSILSLHISIPSLQEQQKVAELLSLIEQRIITQNKIIKKLQSLIKGIIVSHYSTTAHTIKVKIRELGEAYSTMVMSKEQLTNDGNLCVFYGELFTLYGCVIDKVRSRTSLEKVSSTLSHGRDLLFPASTTVDAVSLIAPSALMQKGIILGGDMFGIKVSEAYNPIYLSYYFNYIANKRLAKYAKGTTIIHLHYNEIANVAIELPNIEEQDKIVSTILEYSAKLSIEETILEKLFDLKQYLLKQLFI